MDDKASLREALEGAYAVFLVTNYWDTMSAEMEKKQGMNVADAAKVRYPSSLQRTSILIAYTRCRKPASSTSFSVVY
jgi:NmrA-like family